MKNNLDKQYTDLLQDILDNGVKKGDRTGTGTLSVFGRQIRHKMSDGFPLLTTKKMYFKGIVTELLWFLRGDTNIKFLVDNGCHIWDGDAYKNYEKWWKSYSPGGAPIPLSKEEFINRIKTDDEFAKKWGSLGKIYGKQWRDWESRPNIKSWKNEKRETIDDLGQHYYYETKSYDQIANLINDLKTNPDSRRLLVSAWNPSEVDSCVLPPCHYGFQVYTRELSYEERCDIFKPNTKNFRTETNSYIKDLNIKIMNDCEIPTRAISLMWNQRSVDVPLGLPFNIASYGLLLEIIAKIVNMVPDELIGNLGDTHIYSNQIDGCKEQIGKLSWEQRKEFLTEEQFKEFGNISPFTDKMIHWWLNCLNIPYSNRMPYLLPTLNINTEFWPTQSGECGVGKLTDNIDFLIKEMRIEDFQIENYQSHPAIKFPLSN
jgi:thymidylate synthase